MLFQRESSGNCLLTLESFLLNEKFERYSTNLTTIILAVIKPLCPQIATYLFIVNNCYITKNFHKIRKE